MRRGSTLAVMALLVISVSVAAAQDTGSVNATSLFNTSTIYNKTGTLSPLHFNLYGIPVPEGDGTPDVLLTLNSTSGGTGLNLYCNPGYGAYADPNGNYPSPGYAVWSSDLSTTVNQIFISKNDPQYQSPTANASDTPFFICSVINSDANTTSNYTLFADIVPDNRTLVQAEQTALASLFNTCCSVAGTCEGWKSQNSGYVNANGGAINTDFCSFPGQICDPAGNLYRLDLSSYNLSCAWPGSTLSTFSALSTLSLGSNLNITGSISDVMSTVANLTKLQFFDISSNTGITGSINSGNTYDNVCAAAKRLVNLGLEGIGLGGSIPGCLFAAGSSIVSAELGYNNFTGSLPNTFPVNASIQLLHVHNNDLTGSLPASLTNATFLVELDTSENMMSGSIPSGIGNIQNLESFVVTFNHHTGAIPDSFGTAPNLATFDVKGNSLTKLPSAWTNASYNAVNSSLVNIRASFNNISGGFPTGLIAAQQLTYLVLNMNNISGPLPTNISMFPGLRALNMSSNALTGTIPSQFGQSGIFTANPLYLTSGLPLGQVFDLSYNKLVGSLPTFLSKSAVPIWTQGGIYLQGNQLSVNCSSGQNNYSYITSVCPAGTNTTTSTQQPTAAPPAQAPAKSSPAAKAPSQPAVSSGGVVSVPTPSTKATPVQQPVNSTTTVQSQSGTEKKSGGSSGLSGGAIAGIVIGVLAAVALAAVIGFFAFRRRRQPMMPKMSFGMPNFGDGEFGRKSSLTKGLTTLNSAHSGFERFNDVELSPSNGK